MTPRQKRLAMELRQYEAGTNTALMKVLKKAIVNVRSSISGKLAELGNAATNVKAREQAIQAAVDALEKMQVSMSSHLKSLTDVAARNAHDDATEELKESGRKDLVQYDPARSERYLSYLAPRNAERLAAVFTDKMQDNLVRTLRFAYIDVARKAAVEGLTHAEVNKELQDRWQKDSGNESLYRFVDKSGRAWENARYFQMLTRTNAQRVWTDSYCDSLASNGFKLARINEDGDPDCPICAAWEGRIVCVAGKQKGFPTYADAQEAGVFHPNCTHRLRYIDETIDADEIALQAKNPPSGLSTEAMQEQKDKIDVTRYVNQGQTKSDAIASVASDRLSRNIRSGLFSDELATVASQLPKDVLSKMFDNGIPRFAVAKKDDDPWSKMRGVLLIPKDATPEELFLKLGGGFGFNKEVAAKPVEPPKKRDFFPESVNGLKTVRELGGSTGAKLVEDDLGNRFVMKRGASPEHLRSECDADAAYIAAGVAVPEFRLYDDSGTPVKLSRFIDEAKTLAALGKDERETVYEQLRKDLHVDVLLGNWDVLGLGMDNVLVDKNGKAWRIDNGGALGFRAQGEKKDTADWEAGWIDDVWSMRNLHPDTKKANKNLGAAFGSVQTVSLVKAIRDGKFDGLLEKLPEKERAIVKERIKEATQLADRGEQFVSSGYEAQYTEKILWNSYSLSKEGFREEAKLNVGENNYGFYRSGGSTKSVSQTHANVTSDILGAVKTINFHLSKGDTDFNQSKIDAALSHGKLIEKAVSEGWKNAKEAADAIKLIQDTVSGKNKAEIGKFTATSLEPQSAESVKIGDKGTAPKAYTSLTDHIHDYMKRVGADPSLIVKWQQAQGGNSWNDAAVKFKIAQENTRLVDEKFTWHGEGVSKPETNYKAAKKTSAAVLNKIIEAKAAYQSAIVLCLENSTFDHNDRAARTVYLSRTEKDTVVRKYGLKVGEASDYQRGASESHGVFKTVVVEGDCLTVGEVPYSNILGFYMLEREPGNRVPSFLGDHENEIVCDTRGIPFKYVGTTRSGQSFDKHKNS